MSTQTNIKTDSESAVACTGLLADIHIQLLARAEQWRNSPSDPYNIANAVQVALTEVANSINAAIKANAGTQRPGIAEATTATAADMPGSLK